MKKKLLFLLMTILALAGAAPDASAVLTSGKTVFFYSNGWEADDANMTFNFNDGTNYNAVNGTKLNDVMWCAVVPSSPSSVSKLQMLRKSSDWNTEWNYSANATASTYFYMRPNNGWDKCTLGTSGFTNQAAGFVKIKGNPVGSGTNDGWSSTANFPAGTGNGVYAYEFTVNYVQDGKCYFRVLIGSSEFGPTSTTANEQVSSSGSWLGKDNTSKAFYIPSVTAGEKYKVTVNLSTSKVTYVKTQEAPSTEETYTFTITGSGLETLSSVKFKNGSSVLKEWTNLAKSSSSNAPRMQKAASNVWTGSWTGTTAPTTIEISGDKHLSMSQAYSGTSASVTLPECKTYTVSVNAADNPYAESATVTIKNASGNIESNKTMTKSGNNFTYSMESFTVPTQAEVTLSTGQTGTVSFSGTSATYTASAPETILLRLYSPQSLDITLVKQSNGDFQGTIPVAITAGQTFKVATSDYSQNWGGNNTTIEVGLNSWSSGLWNNDASKDCKFSKSFEAGATFKFGTNHDCYVAGTEVDTWSLYGTCDTGGTNYNDFLVLTKTGTNTYSGTYNFPYQGLFYVRKNFSTNNNDKWRGDHWFKSGATQATLNQGTTWNLKFDWTTGTTYTVTWNSSTHVLTITQGAGEGSTEVAAHTFMPLTERDFKTSTGSVRPHYFLVGTRTGDWRLLPEWELDVNAAGTQATLSGRMIYTGYYGIAKVDNYNDYVHHRYTLYYTNYWWFSGNLENGNTNTSDRPIISRAGGANLYKAGFDGTPAGFVNGAADPNKDNSIMVFTNTGTTYTDITGDLILKAPAKYLTNLTVGLNSSGVPSSIKIEAQANEVAAHRTFSLVGGNIAYNGTVNINVNGASTATAKQISAASGGITHMNNSDQTGWQNSWISFDGDIPYIDAYGNALPLTAYDSNWLAKPRARFKDTNGFEYSSQSVIFKPADLNDKEYGDLYTMHPAGSADGASWGSNAFSTTGQSVKSKANAQNNGGFQYTEKLICNGTTAPTATTTWKPYVVENMWMQGEFKIWAGWGGANKSKDGSGADDPNNARWFYNNGGHGTASSRYGIYGYDPSLGGAVQVYGTKRDVNGANFGIGADNNTRVYYKRVILWFNETAGMDGAVLQFVREQCGTNIEAQHKSGAATDNGDVLQYHWLIDNESNNAGNYYLTHYEIYRRTLDNDGNVIGTTKIKEEDPAENTLASGYTSWQGWFDDPTAGLLGAGHYDYTVTVTLKDKTTGTSTTRTAVSNDLYITSRNPLSLQATQMKDGDNYTFNILVKTDINEIAMRLKANGGTGEQASELVRYVTWIADDAADAAAGEAGSTYRQIGRATQREAKFFTVEHDGDGDYAITSDSYNHSYDFVSADAEVEAQLPGLVWGTTSASHRVWVGHNSDADTDADGYLKENTRYLRYDLQKIPGLEVPDIILHNVMPSDLVGDLSNFRFKAFLTPNDDDDSKAAWATFSFNLAKAETPVISPDIKVSEAEATGEPFTIGATDSGTAIAPIGDSYADPENPGKINVNKMKNLPAATIVNGKLSESPIFYHRVNFLNATPTVTIPLSAEVLEAVQHDNTGGGLDPYFILDFDYNPDGTGTDKVFNHESHFRVQHAINTANGAAQACEINGIPIPESQLTREVSSVDGFSTYATLSANSSFEIQPYVQVVYHEYDENSQMVTRATEPRQLAKAITINMNVLREPTIDNTREVKMAWQKSVVYNHYEAKNYYMARVQLYLPLVNNDEMHRNRYLSFYVYDRNKTGDQKNWLTDEECARYGFINDLSCHGGAPINWAVSSEWTSNDVIGYQGLSPLSEDETDIERLNRWNPAVNDWSSFCIDNNYVAIDLFPVVISDKEADVTREKIAQKVNDLSIKLINLYPYMAETNDANVEFHPHSAPASVMRKADGIKTYDLSKAIAIGASSVFNLPSDKLDANPATGVESISIDDIEGAEFFNLQGIRVDNPVRGQIYIVRKGAATAKMLVK